MGGSNSGLLDFYNDKLKRVQEFNDKKKLDIPGQGDCCPIALIISMLAEGVLVNNKEARAIVVKFLQDIFTPNPGVPKDIKIFLENYKKVSSEQEIKRFFNGLKKTAESKEIKVISDQLRLAAENYLKENNNNDRNNLILIEALAYPEGQKLTDPFAYSQVISYAPLFAYKGIGIDTFDPLSLKTNTNPYLKGGMNRIEPKEKEILTLNVYFHNNNHYEVLIKEDSITKIKFDNRLDEDDYDAEEDDSDYPEQKHAKPTVTLKSTHANITPLKYEDFKSYLLKDYDKKYTVQETDNNLKILLNKEPIATVAEGSNQGIKLDIAPGKETDGAFVALSSFKGFIDSQGENQQDYKAHFTGYDTEAKANGFLDNLYNVFGGDKDVFSCDLLITFDKNSEQMIRRILLDSSNEQISAELELKRVSLRSFFGVEDPEADKYLNVKEDHRKIRPEQDDDARSQGSVDSLATAPEITYKKPALRAPAFARLFKSKQRKKPASSTVTPQPPDSRKPKR